MKYKIMVSYDGTDFCGWQSQPNGKSVQDALEAAINKLTGEDVRVTGSGRTDAGVHAIAQVASFSTKKKMPLKNIIGGLNAYLPRSVRVLAADYATADFDARKSAKKKTYMYVMYSGIPFPFLEGHMAFVPELNVERMEHEAQKLVGRHDFSTFKAANGGAKTFTRTVFDAHFEADGAITKFFITADGFLYNMVRIIVAQLIKIGMGEDIDIAELLQKKDRSCAKDIAPACGLYLYTVDYGEDE